ncbi:MAG: hypothetical protein ACKOWF_16830 [Chloroflexota bacterium]
MDTFRKGCLTALLGLSLASAWAAPATAGFESLLNRDGEGPKFEAIGMLTGYRLVPSNRAYSLMAEVSVIEGADIGDLRCNVEAVDERGDSMYRVGFSCVGLERNEPVPVFVRVFRLPLADPDSESEYTMASAIALQCTEKVMPKAENHVLCGGEERLTRR